MPTCVRDVHRRAAGLKARVSIENVITRVVICYHGQMADLASCYDTLVMHYSILTRMKHDPIESANIFNCKRISFEISFIR